MKILILSPCGRSYEAEDTSRLNLYLASLKKHVVPYFDTKVILFNTANSNELTEKRVKEFELENVVEVMNIDMMELSPNALKFWHSKDWYPRVTINMNMLFDYAKRHNFFNADWVFHVDTDLEYINNFKDNLERIHILTEINPKVVITLSGDTFPYNFEFENKQYILEEPKRLYMYDENEDFSRNFEHRQLVVKERVKVKDYNDSLIFHIQQQKNRNDFFGMSRQTCVEHEFNWCHAYFLMDTNTDLDKKFKEVTTEKFILGLSQDKGSVVHEVLQSGRLEIARVTLRVAKDMVIHHGPGWSTEDMTVQSDWNFKTISHKSLLTNYEEYKDIWYKDYEV